MKIEFNNIEPKGSKDYEQIMQREDKLFKLNGMNGQQMSSSG